MLSRKDRDELNELLDIRRKKKDLINRLRAQKDEHKFKDMEDRIYASAATVKGVPINTRR